MNVNAAEFMLECFDAPSTAAKLQQRSFWRCFDQRMEIFLLRIGKSWPREIFVVTERFSEQAFQAIADTVKFIKIGCGKRWMPQHAAVIVRRFQKPVGASIQIDKRFIARLLITVKLFCTTKFIEKIRATGPK